jgi:hypothetical protein
MYWPASYYDDIIKQPSFLPLHHVRKYNIYPTSFFHFKSSTNFAPILTICECFGPQLQVYALLIHINNSTINVFSHPFLIFVVEHTSLIANLLMLTQISSNNTWRVELPWSDSKTFLQCGQPFPHYHKLYKH